MCTHNTCFCGEVRKNTCIINIYMKKEPYLELCDAKYYYAKITIKYLLYYLFLELKGNNLLFFLRALR